MRLVFAGTPQVALPTLDTLHAGEHEVVAAVTRPDAAAGRGRRVGASPVAERAEELGIPVLKPRHPADREFAARLRELRPDCCPVVGYGALLPEDLLSLPPHGWVNLHFSLLPAWRGAAPVQRAVMAGDEVTGATVFAIVPELDAGPTYGLLTERIGPTDTAGDLLERLARHGAGLLADVLDHLDAGDIEARPQPEDGLSYAPKVSVEDARVDWGAPAFAVDRLVRGCTPAPGAWTTLEGTRLKLGPVRLADDGPTLGPGEARVSKHAVHVGTSTAPVVLGEVQPPGKKAMPAPAWARGARLGDGVSFA